MARNRHPRVVAVVCFEGSLADVKPCLFACTILAKQGGDKYTFIIVVVAASRTILSQNVYPTFYSSVATVEKTDRCSPFPLT